MGRNITLTQINGHKNSRKEIRISGILFLFRVRVTPLAIDYDQVLGVLFMLKYAKICFTMMIFRLVHLSTYLMNAIKTGSALLPSSKMH